VVEYLSYSVNAGFDTLRDTGISSQEVLVQRDFHLKFLRGKIPRDNHPIPGSGEEVFQQIVSYLKLNVKYTLQ